MNRAFPRAPILMACIAGALLGAGALHIRTARAEEPPFRLAAPSAGERDTWGLFVGVGSCAATACHGGPAVTPKEPPERIWFSEYSHWAQLDPHARALQTLHSEESQLIAQKLGLGPAHRAEVCLNCHAVTRQQVDRATGHTTTIREDVSCEACHGAARDWLEPHKRLDWKDKGLPFKIERRFNDTKDALVLAGTCAKCHIGSKDRDVNHDLIAAGHPRLYFEMSAFLDKLPRHWSRHAGDTKRDVEQEPRLWAVGQFAAAEAAVNLLRQRASLPNDPVRPQEAAVWPEFAESACFACHHDLTQPSWRQDAQSGDRQGKPRWGSWYLALAGKLAQEVEGPEARQSLQAEIDLLTREMTKPIPGQEAVIGMTGRLSVALHRLAQAANRGEGFTPTQERALLNLLLGDADAALTQDWESATQVYLGLAAVAHSRLRPNRPGTPTWEPPVFQELQEFRNLLIFPGAKQAGRFTSPANFDTDRIRNASRQLEKLRRELETR